MFCCYDYQENLINIHDMQISTLSFEIAGENTVYIPLPKSLHHHSHFPQSAPLLIFFYLYKWSEILITACDVSIEFSEFEQKWNSTCSLLSKDRHMQWLWMKYSTSQDTLKAMALFQDKKKQLQCTLDKNGPLGEFTSTWFCHATHT